MPSCSQYKHFLSTCVCERFEIYDYDSLDQLQSAYLKFVDELLIRIGPTT